MDRLPETDEECLTAFENCELPWYLWNHRMHVRVAWMLLRREGPPRGLKRLRACIQRYNRANGRATSYHETITVAWARLIVDAMLRDGSARDSLRFLEQNPSLVDPGALLVYFRSDVLFSPGARSGWVEPDLAPLPHAGLFEDR